MLSQYFIYKSLLVTRPVEVPQNPCEPSPCGANAICRERNGAGSCVCLPEYFGDPYSGCRPECVLSTDCARNKACINNKCKDPCPGTCGVNAECRVSNHAPSCFCLQGFTGNALTACHPIPASTLFIYFLLKGCCCDNIVSLYMNLLGIVKMCFFLILYATTSQQQSTFLIYQNSIYLSTFLFQFSYNRRKISRPLSTFSMWTVQSM